MQRNLCISFKIQGCTSNILYIKRIKILVISQLYYKYYRYNDCLCTSALGVCTNVTPPPFMSYRFLFCVIAFCASHL